MDDIYVLVDPNANPLLQTAEIPDLDLVKWYAERLAQDVYKSFMDNHQLATVRIFAAKVFERKYQELREKHGGLAER